MARAGLARVGMSWIVCLCVQILVCGKGLSQMTPANDAFANRTTLSGSTNFVSASNVGATREDAEPQHAGTVGGSSVWWSWIAPTSGTYTVSTKGSSFDTLLAVYVGNALGNLSPVASNDDSTNDTTSILF